MPNCGFPIFEEQQRKQIEEQEKIRVEQEKFKEEQDEAFEIIANEIYNDDHYRTDIDKIKELKHRADVELNIAREAIIKRKKTDIMFCPRCGKEIKNEHGYCSVCGRAVSSIKSDKNFQEITQQDEKEKQK